MKATSQVKLDEESEGEDGENDNLALMAKSDIDLDRFLRVSKTFSNLKSDYKVEPANAIKHSTSKISKLEETVSFRKTATVNRWKCSQSLKDELNTIKEGKTSSSEIIINDQGFHETGNYFLGKGTAS
ncbi:hypothetical protein HAX54_002772 [Datura stramonium]|uniref:Uncharacterized protein n=1 Tax=Datura stramonium TaxID=4076 RepID=A0ABS8WTP8_DATST|nr:hypothetical protein [Datura stramonium]